MTEHEQLGLKIKEVRRYLGYSQQQVANHLGLHREAISEIEKGGRRVTALELVKLARLFGYPTNYFHGTEAVELSEDIVERLPGLTKKDRAEVLRFAEFLHWRKRQKGESNAGTDTEAGGAGDDRR